MPRATHHSTTLLITLCLMLTACSKAYYSVWEHLGYHKRDIMVERVEEARDDQQQAKEQFTSALDKFSAMFNFEGGDLQEKYDTLKSELEVSEKKAKAVSDRIDSVESVAEALFSEWEGELDQYTNQDLRRASETELRETRKRYDQMVKAMRKAEASMQPVLATFRDQVLFLKHNLNARAIASIEGESENLQADVANLIKEMEASIQQADAFIDSMGIDKTQ